MHSALLRSTTLMVCFIAAATLETPASGDATPRVITTPPLTGTGRTRDHREVPTVNDHRIASNAAVNFSVPITLSRMDPSFTSFVVDCTVYVTDVAAPKTPQYPVNPVSGRGSARYVLTHGGYQGTINVAIYNTQSPPWRLNAYRCEVALLHSDNSRVLLADAPLDASAPLHFANQGFVR